MGKALGYDEAFSDKKSVNLYRFQENSQTKLIALCLGE